MTRFFVFLLLLFVLVVACTPLGAGDTVAHKSTCNAVTISQQTPCRVLEFYFCDARPEVKKQMMVGPFRLLGVPEKYTCFSLLLPPFSSSICGISSYYTDGFTDTVVAMYSDKRGFFREYSPCWRLRIATNIAINVDNLMLEVNYSYYYDDGNKGFVKAMQRLPLRTMAVSACMADCDVPETLLYSCRGDENMPFSIVCLSFMLPINKYYPL